MRHRLKLLTLPLIGCAAALFAGEPKDEDRRNLPAWKEVSQPFEQLEWDGEVEFGEGSRGMRDAFPFLAATRGGDTFQITPNNLSHFLRADADGKVIHSSKQAIEAVRFFLAGPLVTTAEAANRIATVASSLPKAAGCSIRAGTMPGAEPSAVRVEETRGGATLKYWKVTMVGLEMSRRLRVVQINANVTEKGLIQRRVVVWVDGPALVRQTLSRRAPTNAERQAAEQRRRATQNAMIQLAKAAGRVEDRTTAWALSRVLRTPGAYKELFGDPAQESGEGRTHRLRFDLEDESKLLVNSKSAGPNLPFVVDSVVSHVPLGPGMANAFDVFQFRRG